MSEPIEDRVTAALAEVRDREAANVRAEAAAAAAQADYERALLRLQEEFGVSSPAEAKALYDKLGGDLEAELEKVNAALAEASPEEVSS
jgi:hypothetical protein